MYSLIQCFVLKIQYISKQKYFNSKQTKQLSYELSIYMTCSSVFTINTTALISSVTDNSVNGKLTLLLLLQLKQATKC